MDEARKKVQEASQLLQMISFYSGICRLEVSNLYHLGWGAFWTPLIPITVIGIQKGDH